MVLDTGTPEPLPQDLAEALARVRDRFAPVLQVNPAAKLGFFDGLASLPVRQKGENAKADEFLHGIVSYQHPDHDTEHWSPGASNER